MSEERQLNEEETKRFLTGDLEIGPEEEVVLAETEETNVFVAETK